MMWTATGILTTRKPWTPHDCSATSRPGDQPKRCLAALAGIGCPEPDTAVSRVWVDLTGSYVGRGCTTPPISALSRKRLYRHSHPLRAKRTLIPGRDWFGQAVHSIRYRVVGKFPQFVNPF